MKVTIKSQSGQVLREIESDLGGIQNGRGTQAVHDTVVAFRSAQRSGTACTKTMGDVNGTGKKPWRQKGTGRARAGSFASPLWRGGGVVFGPKPRDFSKKVNKETRRLALDKVVSSRMLSGDFITVDTLSLAKPSTKVLLQVLESISADGTVLLVVEGNNNRNLILSARNIPHVEAVGVEGVNPYQLLRNDKIVITENALKILAQRVAEGK